MTLVAKDSFPNPFWIMLDHVDDINNVQDKLSSQTSLVRPNGRGNALGAMRDWTLGADVPLE